MPTTYAIPDGRTVMAATLYTGDGASSRAIGNAVNGVSFQPDFVWIKSRSNVRWHLLTDSVRGATKTVFSNDTSAEQTLTDALLSFNSGGFNVGSNTDVNANTNTFVAWNWKAGGAAVTNTAGSISSQVSANTTAGFSVVTYTGTGSAATVGHGLGVAPAMIIAKNRSAAADWYVAFAPLAGWNWASDYLVLNATSAKRTDGGGTVFPVAPTSSVFTVGGAATNASGQNFVAYCYAPVAGYSAFGSYTGNGSADGPFVYTGFRPRFVLTKRSDAASSWYLRDTSRSSYNAATEQLYPDLSNAEANETGMDVLSNGFKQRGTSSGFNTNGGTYIYAAFAENPFKYSNAR